MFAAIVLSTIPTDWVSWSRNSKWLSLNGSNDASSMTALMSPSNSTGSTTTLSGWALPEPDVTWR